MRKKHLWYGLGIMAWGAWLALSSPAQAEAATYEDLCGLGADEGSYMVYVPEDGSADIYVSMDSYDIVKVASTGEAFAVTGTEGDGWMGIDMGDGTVGYVSDEQVQIYDPQEWEAMLQDPEVQAQMAAAASRQLRQQVVDYAMQFLGCGYVYGGNNPSTGVDCSGFTRFVMQNAAGVYLERCSASQAGQGVTVAADQVQPGDLVFYGKGGTVNHVAIYIGDGKIIHASTEKTGVKISNWAYRSPLRIANVLG